MATFEGTPANETITGSFDNDLIDGKGGFDTLIGGDGSDTYIWYGEPLVIKEEFDAGMDYISSSIVSGTPYTLPGHVDGYTVTGGGQAYIVGNDLDNNFYGGNFADTFDGSTGDDKIDGGAGNDRMVGGLGSDRYEVDSVGDIVVEEAGIDSGWDTVRTQLSTFTLKYANVEVLW